MPCWGLKMVVLKTQGNIIMNLHVLFLFNKLYLYVCFCYITVSHSLLKGSSWLWSYSSWIYSYLWNQCLTSLKLPVRIRAQAEVLSIPHYEIKCVSYLQQSGRLFFPVTSISSTNKIDRQYISDILLKVSVNTISLIILLNYFRTKRYDKGFILVHSCLMNINNSIHSFTVA
jgi:hypothetical protein